MDNVAQLFEASVINIVRKDDKVLIPVNGEFGTPLADLIDSWGGHAMNESIKQEVWKEAVKQCMTCDVMIIVGTSLVVSPANTLHFYAKNNQAAIVDINPENTPFSYEMDFSIRQTAVGALSRLISIFESPF